ncbi:MAG: alpha-2-macroglobulin [Saprospiraceae bacterium]
MKRISSLLCLLSILLVSACDFGPDPASAEAMPSLSYAPYISAFSSGLVGARERIRVEFPYALDGVNAGSDADPKLLSIEPKVEGTLRWERRSILTFTPSESLRQNTTYTATVALGSLRPDVPDSLARFQFSFSAIPQGLNLKDARLRPDPLDDDPRKRQVIGKIVSFDYAESAEIEQTLTVTQNGKNLALSWTHADKGRSHEFIADGVVRGSKEGEITLRMRGDALDVSIDSSRVVKVPSVNSFTTTSIEVEQATDQVVTVFFSDPLSPKQDLTGLVYLSDGTDLRLVKQGSAILAYPTARRTGSLELVVDGSVESSAGGKLGKEGRFKVNFTDLKPALEMTGEGTIVPSSEGMKVPFRAVALKSVNVEIIRVYTSNVAQFLQQNQLDSWSGITRVGRPVYDGKVPLKATGSIDYLAWNYFAIDIAELIAVEPGAIYHTVISFGPEDSRYPCEEVLKAPIASVDPQAKLASFNQLNYYSDYEQGHYYRGHGGDDPCKLNYYSGRKVSRNFLASDIGLMAKAGSGTEMLVVATDLKSTAPLGGIEIDLLNVQQKVMATATTEANGVAIFNLEYQPFLAVAKRGEERGYLRLDDGMALNTSTFDVAGERANDGTRGLIYGERGVWRPGDSIYLTLLLERDEKEETAKVPVIFEWFNPSGQMVAQRAVLESAPGMFSLRTATDPDDPTGPWRARVRSGATTIAQTVRIESIMPNRLKVELGFAGDPVPLYDDSEAELSARWLHGAVSGALKADVKFSGNSINPDFPKYKKYTFRDATKSFSVSDQMVFDGTLSAEGTTTFDLGIENLEQAPGMINARFTTRVFEKTGAFSTVVQSATLSPFKTYVGLKRPESKSYYGLNASETQNFQLIVLDENGSPVDREELHVEIYDIDWSYWWERNRGNTLSNYVANKAQHIAIETTVSAQNGKGTYLGDFSKMSYGRKMIRVVDPVSGHSTATTFYLENPRWAYDASSRPGGAELLAFNLDKEEYALGEDIKVSLPAFPGGRAFVTVESGSQVLSYRWVEGNDEPQEVRLGADAEYAPNAYVHVSLLQPHAQTGNDQPIRMYGIQPFTVKDANRQLSPKLALPAELSPEETFTVEVSETDGRAMSYTLAIVEEGLLDITNFKTPDPYARFNRRTAHGVRTWDLYRYVVGAFTGKLAGLFAIGGDEDGGDEADPRANRFRPVVKYVGPFQLAKGKTVKHTFEMPNYIGSVRAMVVSSAGEAYGATEETRPVKRPLMVLATMPRVLGPGETIELPVTVFGMDPKIKNVEVKLEGLELLTTTNNTTSVSFAEPGEQMATFTVKVPELLGVAKVKVTATGAGFSASDEIELQVRAPNPEVADVKSAVLEPGESWSSIYEAPGMKGTNTGTFEISGSLPLNLENRLGYLTRYPHGCLEQTTSAAFPQLYLSDLVKLEEERSATVQRNVKAAIQKIERYSRNDGSYSYWPGGSNYAAWATSYAGHFLLEAKDKGYRISETRMNRWKQAQKRQANAWTPQRVKNYRYEQPVTQAYRLFTLARAKSTQLGAMNRLRGYDKLDATSKEFLAAAYALAGQRDVARELLASTQDSKKEDDYYRYSYGSRMRDLSVSLYVHTMLGEREKAFKLAETMSAHLSSERWYSTQSTAWGLLAMSTYTGGEPKNKPLVYTYAYEGAESAITQGENVRLVDLPEPPQVGQSFSVENKGERRMYVRLVTSGIPTTSQSKAESSNLKMTVKYTDLGGKKIDPRELRQGQDFLAVTTISHPGSLRYYSEMAYTQIFPSGWEIRNERLEGQGRPSGVDYQDIRDDRVMSYFNLARHKSITLTTQLNAAYLGKYFLPDQYAQAMYDRDIRARVPGMWVEVK